MTTRATFSVSRAAAAITGVGMLSAAFVVAPTLTVSAPAPAAKDVKPAKPTTRTVALAAKPVTTAAKAGPETKVPASAFTNSAKRTIDRAGLFDDAVVEVPATGDLVGVTWPATAKDITGRTVLVRAKTDAGWQAWHRLTIDPTNAVQGERLGTEPVWEPGAKSVQVRVAKADKALLGTASLAAVSAPAASTDGSLTPTAVPGAASAAYTPAVISRAQWGADESLRRCPTEYDRTTKAVVVHHTADTNYYTQADSPRMMRSILAYATNGLGWCDLAYNAVVDKYGQVFEGRAGGLSRPVRGAHAYAFNIETFGVSILGNYDTTSVPWAGFNALAKAIAMRLDSFYLDPYAKVPMTASVGGGTGRYAAGTQVTLNRIGGHRDTSYTACPGRYLYPRLGELRDAVNAKLTYKNSTIYTKYVRAGGAAALGPVTVGESTRWAGTKATVFTGGRRIYAGPRGTYMIGPGTENEWLRYGGGPKIGNLISDETSTALGTYTKLDSGRYITWSRGSTATSLINGGILAYWLKTGGASSSPFGMGAASIESNAVGWWQAFTNGHIFFSRANQGFGTIGAIDKAYFANGGPNGWLGFPTGDRYAVAGGYAQRFAGGTITITSAGTTQLTRR